jgi:hypothetical protein
MQKKPDTGRAATEPARKSYAKPKLTRYGAVRSLTRSGISTRNEGAPALRRVSGSDRRLKESIERIGTHPLGFDLYLFDYKPEFRDRHGHVRQLGVMADEVVAVMPAAVSRDEDGYLAVDYGALGIVRNRDD